MRLAPIVGTQEQVKAVVDRVQAAEGACGAKSIQGQIYTLIGQNTQPRSMSSTQGQWMKYPVKMPITVVAISRGVVYDKAAMEVASEALGHSRISVIAGHYIRG